MAQELSTSFQLPKWDAKRKSSTFIGVLLVGAVGFFVYTKILPWLLGIVWGTVELAIGGVVLAFLLGIVSSKRFWRGMHYLTEAVARYTLGLAIELNPWNILNEQVDTAEKDAEKIKLNGDKLKGQKQSLQMQIQENNDLMKESSAEIKILQDKMRKDPNDLDTQLALQSSTTNFANAKDFIDQVSPLLNDINKIVDFADKAYKMSKAKLKDMRNTIKIKKATFDAVNTGNAAMQNALKAFAGHTDLNSDSEKALDVLRNRTAQMIGEMRSAITITSEIMNQNDIKDAAKVSMAVDAASKFEFDKNFDYAHSLDANSSVIGQTKQISSPTNKYMDFLNNK